MNETSGSDRSNQPEELDLRSYVRPVWRRKWIVLAIVVVATAATYFIASRRPKEYTSSTDLYVQVADPTLNLGSSIGSPGIVTSQQLGDVAQLITAQSVTSAVSHAIGVPVAAAGSVTTTPSTTSDFVTVTATSHDPAMAARLANGYVSAFLAARRQAVTSEALTDVRAARATLSSLPNTAANADQRKTVLDQIANYEQIAANPTAGARPIDTAAVPTVPSSPKPKRDAIFGGVVGLVLAIIVAFGLELLDRRLSRIATVESVLGRPVLAVLPHVEDPTPLPDGSTPIVPAAFLEELRSLRVMLRLSGEIEDHAVIMITSALPREGKSTLTRDLALVHAEAGEKVLVIDSDLRRPSIATLFGITPAKGLAHVLRGEAKLAEAVSTVSGIGRDAGAQMNGNGNAAAPHPAHRERDGSLDVLADGEQLENPIALLSSENMWALLEEARQTYDVILLDTAPVLTVADNVSQMKHADAVLLVTRLGQVTRDSAQRFNDVIGRLPAVNVAGLVVNDQRERSEGSGYGSYGRYGYGYYSSHGDPPRKHPAAATL